MALKEEYIAKLERIPTVSFNKEQKQIAKKIIENTADNDLNAVYNLITQRVKTGFVFDEAPEVNHDAVALIKENRELSINIDFDGKLEHKLIIGENYDALKNLCATYIDKNGKGLIDVIYIDPPYNTEASKADGNDYKEEIKAEKFIYRDKFTRDGWLNMLNERLKLAKRLLSDTGVIFISIDDSEQAYLKVLCDEIFGENMFEGCLIWKTKTAAKGVPTTNMLVTNHDYILVYSKNKKFRFNGEKRDDSQFSNPDNDPRGAWKADNMKSTVSPNIFTIVDPYTGNKFTKNWAFSKESLEKMIKENKIIWPANATGTPRQKRFKSEYLNENTPLRTLIGEFQSETATNELKKIFNNKIFDFPKHINLIKLIMNQSTKQDSIILDFFAGSGTTGQAVMELNEEDGGKRKFILVTNNENGIGEKITRERLYRVINGKGSNGEKIEWTYTKEKPYLTNNAVRVFNIETTQLTLQDLEKAEELKEKAKLEFEKLNENYHPCNDFDIYNDLSALNPQKQNDGEK